jgi:hypothetical protein
MKKHHHQQHPQQPNSRRLALDPLAAAWCRDVCGKSAPLPTLSLPTPRPVQSPWILESRVLFAVRQVCQCGAINTAYQPNLGARFRHRKTGMIWIIADHPALWNASLLFRIEWREEKLIRCPACLEKEPRHTEQQLSFAFDFLGIAPPDH